MNILLIDDETLFRKGLIHMLRQLDAELELDEARSCAQAVKRLAARDYDLALVNFGMWRTCGINSLGGMRSASLHSMPFVALIRTDDPHVALSAIEHGAMGVIPKTSSPEVLVHALRVVLAHGVYVPPSVNQMNRAADSVTPAVSQTDQNYNI